MSKKVNGLSRRPQRNVCLYKVSVAFLTKRQRSVGLGKGNNTQDNIEEDSIFLVSWPSGVAVSPQPTPCV